MRAAIPLLLLSLGCGTSTITVYRKGETTPAAVVEQSFSGRGCIAVDTTPAGKSSVIVNQDGTSDWSATRLLAFLGDMASAVFGGGDGDGSMQGPSPYSGCSSIFEDNGGADASSSP